MGWRSYNNVKHERNNYYHEATLKNALDALGALFILNYEFARHSKNPPLAPKDATRLLSPSSKLLRIDGDDIYYSTMIC